jgi:hypothetical protein
MKYGLALVLLIGLSTLGCMRGGSTASGSALVHPNFPYAVAYDDEAEKSVLGNEWRLENYRRKEPRPGAVTATDIERKAGYDTTYGFDFNDDDVADKKRELPYPDLVFVHKRTNARLEVATVLLDDRLGDKELRVLLNNIVESGNGTRSLFVGFGRVAAGVQKRFASRLLDSQEAALGDNKGLVATIERADLDQLQLNPKARWRRSRLFLMHAPFDYYLAEGHESGVAAERDTAKYHKYRVLVLVEYSNTPEDFEAQYPEFVRLLNKMHPLSDSMLMAYLAQPLSGCKGHEQKATVKVSVSPVGRADVFASEGIDLRCSEGVVTPYAFAATGTRRQLATQFDFSKSPKPSWLTQALYTEQRPVAEVAEAAAKPEPAAEGAAPTPAPAEAAPSPALPAPSSPPLAPEAAKASEAAPK